MKLILVAFLAIAVGASACATVSPQVRPTSPDVFVGKWIGTWQDVGGASGIIEGLTIEPPRNEALKYSVRLTNAVVPAFGGEAKFAGGELVSETSKLSMVFRLHGDDRLEASYHNLGNNDRGVWSLTRAAITTEELIEKLVRGSPWTGEYGQLQAGTATVSFSLSGGSLKGELVSITGAVQAENPNPGPLLDLRVKRDKINFRWPGNIPQELRLKGEKLDGVWYGRPVASIWLLPSKQ